jgi:hypothetical protein
MPRAAESATRLPANFGGTFYNPRDIPRHSCRCERARPDVFLFSHFLRGESEGCAVKHRDISSIEFAGRKKRKGNQESGTVRRGEWLRVVRNGENCKIASIKSEWIGLEGTKEFLVHVTALFNHFLPLADSLSLSLSSFCAIASCSMLSS